MFNLKSSVNLIYFSRNWPIKCTRSLSIRSLIPEKGTDKPATTVSQGTEGTQKPTITGTSQGTGKPVAVPAEERCRNLPAMDLRTKLLTNLGKPCPVSSQKVTIVGTGAVGMACAYSLLNQRITSDICLIDLDENKARGEQMDLQHGSLFLGSAKIQAGSDYNLSANSKIIIICAGVRQKSKEETRLSLLERNYVVFKKMIPELASKSPNSIFLVVTNPVDVLTHLAWKLSGFPYTRVIGTGTNLDSSRFRFLIAEKLGIAPESVHAWIIGEHGDSSVAVWSSLNVAGVTLREIDPNFATDDDPENWKCIHEEVVASGYKVITLKGYTSWAIGASVADLCSTMLRNVAKVHCVSVYCKGMYGIEREAYLSIPCSLGETGLVDAVIQSLNEEELQKLHQSATVLGDEIEKLNLE